MKAVFDSNVYVSALAIPGGVAARALQAAVEGRFELVLSRPIIVEVLDVLARKFARDAQELSRTALFLSSVGAIVTPRRTLRVLRDEPDNRILECAIEARADVVVTGDRAMLSLGTWEGIRIVALREFVDLLETPPPVVHQARAAYEPMKRKQRPGRLSSP